MAESEPESGFFKGLRLSRRPHSNRGIIVVAALTVLSVAWKVFDAWSNLEFIGQKAGLIWRILYLLFATQTGANVLVVSFVFLLVSSLLFQIERVKLNTLPAESPAPALSDTSVPIESAEIEPAQIEASPAASSTADLLPLIRPLFFTAGPGIQIKHTACGIEETLVHSGTIAVADVYERSYGKKEDYTASHVAYVKFCRDDDSGHSYVDVRAQVEFLDAHDLSNSLFVVDKAYWFRTGQPYFDKESFQVGDTGQLIVAIIRPGNLVLPYSGRYAFSGRKWEFSFDGQKFQANSVVVRIRLIGTGVASLRSDVYRGVFEYLLTTGDAPKMQLLKTEDEQDVAD